MQFLSRSDLIGQQWASRLRGRDFASSTELISPIICCRSKSSLYIDARHSSDYPFYNIVLLLRSTLNHGTIDVIRIIRCRLSRVRTYLLRKYALTHRVGKWPCSLRHLIILQQSVLSSLHVPSATSHSRRQPLRLSDRLRSVSFVSLWTSTCW